MSRMHNICELFDTFYPLQFIAWLLAPCERSINRFLDKFEKDKKFWHEVTKLNLEEMYWKNIDTLVSREHDYRKNDEALGRLGRIIG